jgi:hypothetical protein
MLLTGTLEEIENEFESEQQEISQPADNPYGDRQKSEELLAHVPVRVRPAAGPPNALENFQSRGSNFIPDLAAT